MAVVSIKRKSLPHIKDFKKFWEKNGPFKYALTSREFPPVLLEPEEWIFSDEIKALLKALMQFDKQKMKIVKAPFNPGNKQILRPETLSPWKINNFPEEWNVCLCDIFVPQGHLTRMVLEKIKVSEEKIVSEQVEQAFFQCLEARIEQLGYVLLKPRKTSKYAAIQKYLSEWEKDEHEEVLL